MTTIVDWKYYLAGKSFAYLWIQGHKTSFYLIETEIEEKMMYPYKIIVKAVLDNHLTSEYLGKKVCVSLGGEDRPFRNFPGMIFKFEYISTKESQIIYQIEIYHSLFKLNFEEQIRIFQNKSSKQIIAEILSKANFRYNFLALDKESAEDTNTQYNEKTLNYIIRLMQQKGYYGFLDSDSYCADDIRLGVQNTYTEPTYNISQSVSLKNIDDFIILSPNTAQTGSYNLCELILLRNSNEIANNSFTLFSNNFSNPSLPLTGSSENIVASSKFVSSRYESNYKNTQTIQSGALSKLNYEKIRNAKFYAETTDFRLSPGKIMNVEKGFFMVEKTVHKIFKTETGWQYVNYLEGIVLDKNYLPEINLAKPKAYGTLTAVVSGTKEVESDKYGRVKVRFPWSLNANESAWVRIMQWGAAGDNWGNVSMPRRGQEVVVSFLNADIDLPIIMGSVYNQQNQTPDASGKTLILKTKTFGPEGATGLSFNEFSMSDSPTSQQVYIKAQKNLDLMVLNDASKKVIGSDTNIIGDNSWNYIGGSSYTNIKNTRIESFGPVISTPLQVVGLAALGAAIIGGFADITTMNIGIKLINVNLGMVGVVVMKGNISLLCRAGIMTFGAANFISMVTGDTSCTTLGSYGNRVIGSFKNNVGGDYKLNVSGKAAETIQGKYSKEVKGAYDLSVVGKYGVNVTGQGNLSYTALNLTSQTSLSVKAPNISFEGTSIAFKAASFTINSPNISLSAGAVFEIKSGAMVTIKAAIVQIN